MRIKLVFSVILTAASASGYALMPLGFDAITKTALPHESGLPVSLISLTGECSFYGETRAQPKVGFFNELFDRQQYFVDITKVSCEDTTMTVRVISAVYEKPLKAGDKIRLPFIEFVVSQSIGSVDNFYKNIEIKCESGSVWYTWQHASIPVQVPLWVDGKTISCSNDSYLLGDKTLTKGDVVNLIIKDVEKQFEGSKEKPKSGGGIPTIDAAAILGL